MTSLRLLSAIAGTGCVAVESDEITAVLVCTRSGSGARDEARTAELYCILAPATL
jgi:hypothetical protein